MAKGHSKSSDKSDEEDVLNSIDGVEGKKKDPNASESDDDNDADELMAKMGVIADGKIPYRIITETPNIQGAGAQG